MAGCVIVSKNVVLSIVEVLKGNWQCVAMLNGSYCGQMSQQLSFNTEYIHSKQNKKNIEIIFIQSSFQSMSDHHQD